MAKAIEGAKRTGGAQEFSDLQKYFSREGSLDRIDSYAKWVFGLTAVIGSLGAGLGRIGSPLTGSAGRLFAFAIVALGISLTGSAMALRPRSVRADSSELEAEVEKAFRRKSFSLASGVVALIIAILVASLAPVVTMTQHEPPRARSIGHIGFAFGDTLVSATFTGWLGDSSRVVQLELRSALASPPITMVRASPDSVSRFTLERHVRIHPAKDETFVIIGLWGSGVQDGWQGGDTVTIHLPRRS